MFDYNGSMFTPDLLHDTDAEIARLSQQVADLQAENAELSVRAARIDAERQLWDWFADRWSGRRRGGW